MTKLQCFLEIHKIVPWRSTSMIPGPELKYLSRILAAIFHYIHQNWTWDVNFDHNKATAATITTALIIGFLWPSLSLIIPSAWSQNTTESWSLDIDQTGPFHLLENSLHSGTLVSCVNIFFSEIRPPRICWNWCQILEMRFMVVSFTLKDLFAG